MAARLEQRPRPTPGHLPARSVRRPAPVPLRRATPGTQEGTEQSLNRCLPCRGCHQEWRGTLAPPIPPPGEGTPCARSGDRAPEGRRDSQSLPCCSPPVQGSLTQPAKPFNTIPQPHCNAVPGQQGPGIRSAGCQLLRQDPLHRVHLYECTKGVPRLCQVTGGRLASLVRQTTTIERRKWGRKRAQAGAVREQSLHGGSHNVLELTSAQHHRRGHAQDELHQTVVPEGVAQIEPGTLSMRDLAARSPCRREGDSRVAVVARAGLAGVLHQRVDQSSRRRPGEP